MGSVNKVELLAREANKLAAKSRGEWGGAPTIPPATQARNPGGGLPYKKGRDGRRKF